jgi:hypothetical protein
VFYGDLVHVVKKAQSKTWNGEVQARYKDWFVSDLDKTPPKKKWPDSASSHDIAVDEISKLDASPPGIIPLQ